MTQIDDSRTERFLNHPQLKNRQQDHRCLKRPRLLQIVTAPISANCFLHGQLAYMREQGFEVTVISSPGLLLDQTAERECVTAIGIPMCRQPSLLRDIGSLIALIRIIKRLRPEIVQFSTPKAGLLGSIASYVTRVPVRLYTLRGLRADGLNGLSAKLMIWIETVPCVLSQTTISVSESLMRRAIELGIAKPARIRVLSPQSSNGVDTNRFNRSAVSSEHATELRTRLGLPEDALVIGFVGRICTDKGARELIEAFGDIRKTHPSVHLVCVGPDETDGGTRRSMTRDLLDVGNVHVTGLMMDPRPAYLIIDVLALPTYREGFPNVALEAAAMEIPVVATRVTGCVDAVLDGVTGTLVPVRDAKALTEALRMYLDSPALRMQHGTAARQRAVVEFEPQRIWFSLKEVYVEQLKRRGLPSV